ncbi:MAG: SMC family ATPase, partial [Candidatus Woesearchaeota archaeon]
MFLKSLKLRNIRSYVEEEINFPEGIVLLAGDIGAGKSTILLAIEFALFGILRGELSGAALLRHGAKEGSVELTFELNGKDYVIGRTLKRGKGIEQDTGYLIQNGIKKEATAIELKTAILNLLGYPPELVTKSKSLIYRYTVYTPQEEMKRIILADKEDRLTILRKVFDIDKYKRIIDNAKNYTSHLRENKKELEGQLADEPAKKQLLMEKQKQASDTRKQLLEIQPRLEATKQAVIQQKIIIEGIEKERAALQQHRIAYQSAEAEARTLTISQKQLQAEIAQLAQQVANAPQAPAQTPEKIMQATQQKQTELTTAEKEIRTYITAIAELRERKRLSETTIKRILEMDQCPTCLQKVESTHKHAFAEKEKQNTDAITAQIASFDALASRKEKDKARIQQEINALRQQEALAREAQFRLQQYQQHLQRKELAEKRLAETITAINVAETKKQQFAELIKSANEVEARYCAEKSRLETLHHHEKTISMEHAALLEKQKFLLETIASLEKELEAKKAARQRLEKLDAYNQWVGDFFTNLMSVME